MLYRYFKLPPKKGSFNRVPTVTICSFAAICTFTTFASEALIARTHAAQPELPDPEEVSNFIAPVKTEKPTPIESTALPEALVVQKFENLFPEKPLPKTHSYKSVVQQAPRLPTEILPFGAHSYRAKDLQTVADIKETPTLVKNPITSRETGRLRKVFILYAPDLITRLPKDEYSPRLDINLRKTDDNLLGIESAATVPSQEEIQKLQERLRSVPATADFGNIIQGSPALTITNPTAFGLDNNFGFVSATSQTRTRYTNTSDGALGLGVGLGDARKYAGVEISYVFASFGGSRSFGSGGFNVKVNHQFPGDWAVAFGWNGFLNLGDPNDFKNSPYGVVSKIFRIRDDINSPFSRIAVSTGVGGGQFLSEHDVERRTGSANIFASVAMRVTRPVSLIGEWTGEDLALGLSVVPFKNLPFAITPAVRDITSAGNGPRFVLGGGFAFKF